MTNGLSNEALMQRIQAGDHSAFSALVRHNTPHYHALAFRSLQHYSDAEDAVQNALLNVWEKPHQWHANKGVLFNTWFYRVLLNKCEDIRRKLKRNLYDNFDDFMHYHQQHSLSMHKVHSAEEQHNQQQQQHWQQTCTEFAIAQLPLRQRDALNLAVYCELPQQQVAHIMHISVGAVESLLVRAKQAIKTRVAALQNTQTTHSNLLQKPSIKRGAL